MFRTALTGKGLERLVPEWSGTLGDKEQHMKTDMKSVTLSAYCILKRLVKQRREKSVIAPTLVTRHQNEPDKEPEDSCFKVGSITWSLTHRCHKSSLPVGLLRACWLGLSEAPPRASHQIQRATFPTENLLYRDCGYPICLCVLIPKFNFTNMPSHLTTMCKRELLSSIITL